MLFTFGVCVQILIIQTACEVSVLHTVHRKRFVGGNAQEFFLNRHRGLDVNVNPWEYGYANQQAHKPLEIHTPPRVSFYTPQVSQPPTPQEPPPTEPSPVFCYLQSASPPPTFPTTQQVNSASSTELNAAIDAALRERMLTLDNQLQALYEVIKCGQQNGDLKSCTYQIEKCDQLMGGITTRRNKTKITTRKNTRSKATKKKNTRGKSRGKTTTPSNQSRNRKQPRGRQFNKQTTREYDEDNEQENNADDDDEDEDNEKLEDEDAESNEDDDADDDDDDNEDEDN